MVEDTESHAATQLNFDELGILQSDIQILQCNMGNRAWLNDRLINAGQTLLKEQFPHVGGLQDVAYSTH